MEFLECPRCLKPVAICVCQLVKPIATERHILILQHPQEPDQELGTARLAHLALPNSTLKTGLSWPNLKAALRKEAIPSRWAVLYLGSGAKSFQKNKESSFVDAKGRPLEKSPENIEGLVVLDGTWSQAKTLWWRNAWLLKLRRLVLFSKLASLYGCIRKEPRRECLSTIESIGEALCFLGESEHVKASLRQNFTEFLKLVSSHRKSVKESPNRSKPNIF